jgi:hypothetical protein
MSEQAKNGTAVRVHGLACTNAKCSHYQHIVSYGYTCEICGHELRRGSAAVAAFEWEKSRCEKACDNVA